MEEEHGGGKQISCSTEIGEGTPEMLVPPIKSKEGGWGPIGSKDSS